MSRAERPSRDVSSSDISVNDVSGSGIGVNGVSSNGVSSNAGRANPVGGPGHGRGRRPRARTGLTALTVVVVGLTVWASVASSGPGPAGPTARVGFGSAATDQVDPPLTPASAQASAGSTAASPGSGAGSGTPAPARQRVETPVTTSADGAVLESVVRVKVPLPSSTGPHPAACDWLSYLRYRDRGGPALSAQADRVLVAQPGILEGAGAFDSLARNTIGRAAAEGRHLEFWALDRRSNCLDDLTGLQAATAAGDHHVAVDYYYRHRPIGGRTFAGFLDDDEVSWLARVGLDQTLHDEYDLLVAELPDPQLRGQKVLCGGHSLGGVLTGLFAVHDFDGDHTTTADAGYRQCAGYFALDTTVATSMDDLNGTSPDSGSDSGSATFPFADPGDDYAATQRLLRSGIIPRTSSLPVLINAETMNLLGIAAVAALTNPDGQSDLVQSLPSSLNVDLTTRVLFSRDALTFVTGSPSVKDFRITNEAALGALMDDNSQPMAFLQTSVGMFDGGPIAQKDFPLPTDLKKLPGMDGLAPVFGTRTLATPARPHGPLYTWRNYNRIGAADDPVYRADDGTPFTGPAQEVTDVRELAASMAAHPLDFTEHYFPTKIVTDLYQLQAPELARDAVHRNGIAARPRITLLAGDGLLAGNARVAAEHHPVVAPGYQHLDVLTAARVQNGGRPEIVSTELARFAVSPPE